MSGEYDYLIVGAGLFGSAFADLATRAGKRVLVVEKRDAVGGNIRTERVEGIDVHLYGAHIFHTSNREVWDYVNSLGEFNRFTNSPLANYRGKIYHLPFNMNTFYELWGTYIPADAKRQIEREVKEENIQRDVSAETHALMTVGRTIYKTLIKGYTEKQWNRDATLLPPYIVGRLPVRFNWDNNYFDDLYQGIPVEGYTALIERMLSRAEVRLGVDFLKDRDALSQLADKVVYTGPLDAFFDYKLGNLEYRSLVFKTKVMDTDNYQGNAVVNYTDRAVPYTRVIEHRWFMMNRCHSDKTVVTFEYPKDYRGPQDEPYYPITDTKNTALAKKYFDLAENEPIIFGGRLATYRYLDMDDTLAEVFDLARKEGLIS